MDNLNISYEPMDIDMSGYSNNAMDISFHKSIIDVDTYLPDNTRPLSTSAEVEEDFKPPPSNNTHPPTKIRTFDIKRRSLHKETKTVFNFTTQMKVLVAVLILYLSLIAYEVMNIQCSDSINPDKLKKSLSDKLYGQSQAVHSLVEALSMEEQSKMLFFYGGTGVGKTYTASLLLEHVGHYSNVYHFTMPSFMETFTTEFMIGLTVCKHTTIIVDDLSAKDMNVKTHILDVITKSKNLDKTIIVILIFNCDNAVKDFERQCDNKFPNKLLQNFEYIDGYKKVIQFEPLKEEHLQKCIKTELGNRELKSTDFEKIMKNFNVSLDGCKGVYTKLKLLDTS